jgi:hypothetical protein
MKKVITLVVLCCFAVSMSACGMKMKKNLKAIEAEQNNPVNCATAENDIKVLMKEKANVGEQIFAGLTSVAPPALVMGILTGTETSKIKVALGTYDKLIDARIKKIKGTCNNK